MKIIFASLLTAVLLCGCDKSSAIVRSNEKLEIRLSELETNVTGLDQRNENMLSAVQTNFMASLTNYEMSFDKIKQQLIFDNSRIEYLQFTISNLVNTINQQNALLFEQNNPQPVRQMQIPADVFEQIRAGAVQRFPNDVNRQNDMIKQETNAWYKLNQ